MQPQLKISAANQLSELPGIIDRVEEFLTTAGEATPRIYKICMIIDELFNNVVSYAFSDSEHHDIELVISSGENGIEMTVTDDGIAFNPLGKAAPDTSVPIEDRPIGGLGLHLIRSMANNINYKRTGKFNILHIELR